MKIKLLVLFLFNFSFIFGQENSYFTWKQFVDNFGKEMVRADDVYKAMVNGGLKDQCLSKIDFKFISNKSERLDSLGGFLKTHYPYTVGEVKKNGNNWEISCKTNGIPITPDHILYWALDMYKRAYEFDSKLDHYSGQFDPKNQTFPDIDKSKEEFYFNKGLDCYRTGNLSGAIINWSLTLAINPQDPNSYYSRALVKNELFTWKSAIKDYDNALEIAPNFVGALINRADLKLENGDNEGALDDYNRVLILELSDSEIITSAYYNRGNTKYLLNDKSGACEDWKKALDLGAKYAKERIEEYCN